MGEKLLRLKKFVTFYVLLPVILDVVIESLNRKSLFSAFSYMVEQPFLFLFNVLIIMLTLSVAMYFKREIFVLVFMSVVWLLFGIVNFVILHFRVTPFSAVDFTLISSAISVSGHYLTAFNVVMIFFAIALLVVSLVVLFRKTPCIQKNKTKKAYMLSTFVVLVVITSIFVMHKSSTSVQALAENYTNISEAYENYGFVYCFANSIIDTGIKKPEDYSEESVSKLKATISDKQQDTKVKPDIIMIQLESFFDICDVKKISFSRDPLPNFHRLQKEYTNGQLTVPTVGAGTVNTEFEVLTGMSQHDFGVSEYPYKTVVKNQPCESAATALSALGYGTHGLHNNGGNFYSRAKVYDHMGFDSFTSKEFMNILQLTPNGWAKDEVLVDNIMEAMDTTEQQDFVFTVSVQGHGDYPEEQLIENPKIKVEGIDDEAKKNKWEYYVNMVYEMDQFAGDLVKAVEDRGEPAVVVFYGDHLPTMGLTAEDLKSRYLYNTNYVIWDNIGLEQQDRNIPAYQLMADVMNRLDIHSGTLFNYHQQRQNSKNYLSDLELLQYDILYGKQYVYKGNPPITEGHMEMGVKDATLTNIVPYLEKGYSLYGENFTKSSKVYVNGEKQKSTFLNNTRIVLPSTELSEGDVITVSQVGSSNTIFRTTDEYIYQGGQLVRQEGTGTDTTKSWTEQENEEK